MSKASVSCAIIARNAEKTIGACLDSVVPYVEEVVVCVDRTTTDNTSKVAMAHGARVVQGLVVSEWHECEHHGRILAQDFAEARNRSFSHLRTDTKWLMWLDADDILVGGELIGTILDSLGPEYEGVWFPYQYSSTPNGLPSTIFDRERLMRRDVGWHWTNRVHELCVPDNKSTTDVVWIRTDDIKVVHQDANHDNRKSALRNIALLEICLEEKPGDPWALQYLGNQYIALEEWATAERYFSLSITGQNPYQDWLSHVWRSVCFQKIGDLNNSEIAAMEALRVKPYHPDPYYRLAEAAMLKGDLQACETWTKLADQMEPTPPVVFSNPMDHAYNSRVTLGQAYFNASEVSKARREWEKAVEAVPNETIQNGVDQCKELETNARQADDLVHDFYGQTDEAIRIGVKAVPIPENVWRFGRIRDVVVPALLKTRSTSQPRIVFWCGRSVERWSPESLNTTGIGGSETAVVQIAQRFAWAGWRVDVYNDPDKYEGEYDGVGYFDLNRYDPNTPTDVLVSWRNPSAAELPTPARVRLLWAHDLNFGPGPTGDLSKWDRVLGVSEWHSRYLSRQYQLSNTSWVPNGINLDRFGEEVQKIPFRTVYASSPDRGLVTLLRLWPLIATDPAAELHIAYGWDTIDRYIAGGATSLIPLKAEITRLVESTPRVVWRGRLPQNELAKLYQESYAWLYPTSFTEVSCISAMEAMAGGAVPVTSAVGALSETIGEAGIIVPGNTYSEAWTEFFAYCARAAIFDRETRLSHLEIGKNRVQGLTWDESFKHWSYIVEHALSGEEVLV